ncbi:hypothetical protein K2224_34915 (plasmid) [Streptomyces sp. BHT-5-2]|nr:hypothetical protein K2224_34915 [Streptomyces sp. BHT-5-2]
MTFGFARPLQDASPDSDGSTARPGRLLEPAEWASAGIPLLRDPREVVADLHDRHLPGWSAVVVAVLDPRERIVASASFTGPAAAPDGWEYRNALLTQLRRIIPHDLRLRVPVRTAVLLHCREGDPRWTETDGAWMWGLRDACTLHGLRCGAFIALTRDRWQVLGEGRGGRRPRAAPPGRPEREPDTARPRPRHDAPVKATGTTGGSGSVDTAVAGSSAGSTGPGGTTDPTGTAMAEVTDTTGEIPTPDGLAPDGLIPAGATLPPGPRTAAEQAVRPDRPPGQGATAPQRIPPTRNAAPDEQQPRHGDRGLPRRTAGGAAEARRHRAAR